ncbi:MAG: hypothetical protein KDC44_01205 [Phaeodactylibacter sp.]|nr:hypothetical protein [Phaeodactylibacter sp.]
MKTILRLIAVAIVCFPFVACSPQYGCYTSTDINLKGTAPNFEASDLVPASTLFAGQQTNCTEG